MTGVSEWTGKFRFAENFVSDFGKPKLFKSAFFPKSLNCFA